MLKTQKWFPCCMSSETNRTGSNTGNWRTMPACVRKNEPFLFRLINLICVGSMENFMLNVSYQPYHEDHFRKKIHPMVSWESAYDWHICTIKGLYIWYILNIAATCPDINMSNGVVLYDEFDVNGRYPVNTWARFLCHREYVRFGSSSSTCQISGNWDVPSPQCKSNNSSSVHIFQRKFLCKL